MNLRIRSGEVLIQERSIFSNVTFELAPGEMLALVGASGSGKTTLLHTLGQLHPLTSGEILFDGTPTSGWTTRDRTRFWRESAAFIFQDFGLIEDERVDYNVTLSRSFPWRRASTDNHRRVRRCLDAVGLGDRESDLVVKLSGGERQRVGIARAMYKDAAIIFADEPTASLDAPNRAAVTALLRSEARRGAMVVVATHDEELARLSDACCHLG